MESRAKLIQPHYIAAIERGRVLTIACARLNGHLCADIWNIILALIIGVIINNIERDFCDYMELQFMSKLHDEWWLLIEMRNTKLYLSAASIGAWYFIHKELDGRVRVNGRVITDDSDLREIIVNVAAHFAGVERRPLKKYNIMI